MTSSMILLACLTASATGFLLDSGSVNLLRYTTPPTSATDLLQFTYFDARGRGEITRLLFHAGKKPFVDIRVQGKDWPALKPTTPYGHIPMLNVSGTIYTQSLAIQNYVAKITGLYPSSALDQLMCDQVSFAREDFLIAGYSASESAAANQTFIQKTVPLYLGNFNRYIVENPSNSGYVIGDKLSLADIVVYEGTQDISEKMPSMLYNYPEILALRSKVMASDGIKEYLATRGY